MSNPERGCGKKKEGSFYVEGSMSAEGGLNTVTWLLGNQENYIIAEVPPRAVRIINPIATIVTGGLVLAEGRYQPTEWERGLYERLKGALRPVGIADHVGSNNYSAASFAKELIMFGPSRRIPPKTAVTIGQVMHKLGPLPIMFTHANMPVFNTEAEAQRSVELVEWISGIDCSAMYYDPTWMHQDWGMYRTKDQWTGQYSPQHFMIPVLDIVHEVTQQWSRHMRDTAYISAKKFFEELRFVEQPFCLSWLTQVTYTLPADGKISGETQQILDNIKNVQVVDLKDEENVSSAEA